MFGVHNIIGTLNKAEIGIECKFWGISKPAMPDEKTVVVGHSQIIPKDSPIQITGKKNIGDAPVTGKLKVMARQCTRPGIGWPRQ